MLAGLLASLRKEPLISSLSGDKDMVPLIDAFVAELPARIRKVEEAAAKQDAKALASAMRALKGEAGGYGFEPISTAAGAAESALLAETNWVAMKPLVDELIDLCCQARSSSRKNKSGDGSGKAAASESAESDSGLE